MVDSLAVEADTASTYEPADSIYDDGGRFTIKPFPFGMGEEIVFHVSFGFIPAGKARIAILDTTTINGQLCWRAVSSARSARGFDIIFKVRDSVETWVDADSLYSHRFHKKLHEGPYRDEKWVHFNLADSLAPWWDDGVEKEPKRVEPRIQDVGSAGYKVRMMDMAKGDTLRIRVHDVKKTYNLLVIVHAVDSVETDIGTFECFKLEPVLQSGGIFKKEKGARVFVWITTDSLHIPVKMETKVSFGTVTAVIESYTPGKPFSPFEQTAADSLTNSEQENVPLPNRRSE